MKKLNTRELTYGGLMTALVFVATAIIPHVPVPFTEGYIHTGDSMIFVAAILLGWRYGAIAGGFGSALADIFLGYTHWALPTLIIKGIMGAIVGFIAKDLREKESRMLSNTITVSILGIWIVLGASLKKLLTSKLGDVNNSDLANSLIEKFELNGIGELSNLISHVQNSLLIAIILIPVLVVVFSIVLRNKDKELFSINNLMGMTLAGLWMVIGYYFAGGILKGNMIVPIFSVPSNIIQFVGGLVIAFFIILGLKRAKIMDTIDKNL